MIIESLGSLEYVPNLKEDILVCGIRIYSSLRLRCVHESKDDWGDHANERCSSYFHGEKYACEAGAQCVHGPSVVFQEYACDNVRGCDSVHGHWVKVESEAGQECECEPWAFVFWSEDNAYSDCDFVGKPRKFWRGNFVHCAGDDEFERGVHVGDG